MPRALIRILLADDSKTIHKVVELTFSDGPYEVTSLSDGNLALDAALQQKPDLVLADVIMPGLSGYDLCAEVKRRLPGIPVLLLVGTFEPLDQKAVERCAADGVVTKPFESLALIKQVDMLVEAARNAIPAPLSTGSSRPGRDTAVTPPSVSSKPTSEPDRRLRVFLCHASEDKPAIRKLYHQFAAQGFQPWLDEEDLLPGEDWKHAITNALRQCDAVVVCLSRQSITKTGYVQKEIATALDILAQHPEGSIFLIPLLLEDCQIPDRLAHLHAARLPVEEGFARVCRAIRKREEITRTK